MRCATDVEAQSFAKGCHVSVDPVHRGPADPALGGVSLVFPVHNESFIIEQTLRNYVAELAPRVEDLEVIVAEDGSTDDTKVVLERVAG